MTNRSANLIYNCRDLTATDWQSADCSAAYSKMIVCRKTNFSKTWHADCKYNAVSKILDWLVK